MARAGSDTTRTSPPPPWRGDDFPAWLSPMLVKELRQGIQSGLFAWTFVALQLALLTLMLFWLGVVGADPDRDRSSGGFFRGLFWTLLGGALVVVLPFRGLNALKSEETGNTFDLLRLTRLSATQIVTGKWLATVAQLLLVATAVLPYVVLQYYLGGYGVFADLGSVALLVVAGSVTAAVAILLSSQPQWTRGLALVGVLIGSYATLVAAFGGIGMGGSLVDGWTLAKVVVGAGALILTCLEYTAAMIAPQAENHALRKRALALVFAAIALGMIAIGARSTTIMSSTVETDWMLTVLLMLVATLIVMTELFTDPVGRRSIHEPFTRLGLAGPLLASCFTPGWATAVPLAAVLVAAFVVLPPAVLSVNNAGPWMTTIGLWAAALLFPVPFTRLVPRPGLRLPVYALVTVASCLPLAYQESRGSAMNSTTSEILATLVAILPLPRWLSLPGTNDPSLAIPSILVTGLAWLLLTPAWIAALRRTLQFVAACRPTTGPTGSGSGAVVTVDAAR